MPGVLALRWRKGSFLGPFIANILDEGTDVIVNESGNLQLEVIHGHATATSTAAIGQQHPDWQHAYRPLGSTGLTVSQAGFGTYRVDVRAPMHRAAFAKAIRMGINLVDTSSNYADGNSERLVGDVMAGLIANGICRREDVVIVSKGGYIQGELLREMQAKANAPHADFSPGSELSELVRHSDDLWHSIHPDFLREQITSSLERLRMDAIDVYLLHNPEYFAQWAESDGRDDAEIQREYLARLKKAFHYLESEVANGRIQWYGVSSNTFGHQEGALDRTPLEGLWQAAEEVREELGLAHHHFAVIQCPLNAFETAITTEKNQKRGTMSVLEFANEKNLGVLTNRPLNAIIYRQVVRLADYPEREVPSDEQIDDIVHDLKLQEVEFLSKALPAIPMTEEQREAIPRLLAVGQQLDGGNWKRFSNTEEWLEVSTTILAPRVQYVFDVLRVPAKHDESLFSFLTLYANTADDAFDHITNYYYNKGHARSVSFHEAFDTLMPERVHKLSLSQKAVLLVRSTPGVSSVLVGMRMEDYVDDVVYGLQALALEDAASVWHRLTVVSEEG